MSGVEVFILVVFLCIFVGLGFCIYSFIWKIMGGIEKTFKEISDDK